MIPHQIQEGTVTKARKEMLELLKNIRDMAIKESGKYKWSRYKNVYLDELPEEYKPIGQSSRTCVIPIKTSENGYPLCFKLGLEEFYTRKDSEKKPPMIWSYTARRNPYIENLDQNLDTNKKALSQLELGIIVPPHALVSFPYEDFICDGLLVPDLTNRGRNSIRELEEIEDLESELAELYPTYKNAMQTLADVQIQFFDPHDKFNSAMMWMLFLVEGTDGRFLAAGDLDHFLISYGGCPCCGYDGPINKV